ncbi:MAG: hypothetical protein IBX41_03730 [Methanophagales archaeon]|nr:hypothetical protein [Methanophagales archaeon]
MVNVGQELLNVPFGDMILQMSMAIAEGQSKLDRNAVEIAKFLAEEKIELPKIGGPEEAGIEEFPLIALGFYPSFYQFQESIIEVKMAITMATSTEFKLGVKAKAGWGPFSASVNASYSRKYDYKVEGSSLLRTKLVPVPPPAGLEKYLEALIKAKSAAFTEKIPPAPETPTPTP